MAKFDFGITLSIKKDGELFYQEQRQSTNLEQTQMLEMEQDLWDVVKKWAAKSGLK